MKVGCGGVASRDTKVDVLFSTSSIVLSTRIAVLSATSCSNMRDSPVLRFWIADPESGITNIHGQALLALWDVLKAEGIEIPYPHREVIVRERPSDHARDA